MKQSAHPRKRHMLMRLHRQGGIVAALLVIVICATGISLNHSDALGLNKQTINTPWLMQWYGIKAPPATSYAVNEHFVTQSGSTLLFDGEPLPGQYREIRGAVRLQNFNIVALSDSLALISVTGELIERLQQHHGIPATIRRIGLPADSDNRVALQTDEGILLSDAELIAWEPADNTGHTIAWARPAELPAALTQRVDTQQTGGGLTLERLILDLHSGRLLGAAGPWLADLAAILFIALALSGIWMWFKSRNRY